jgi:hypothetical protein
MHGQAPDQHVAPLGSLWNRVALGIDRQQFAFADERVQAISQLAPSFPLNAKLAQKLLVASRLFLLARDVAEDGGIRQHQKGRR